MWHKFIVIGYPTGKQFMNVMLLKPSNEVIQRPDVMILVLVVVADYSNDVAYIPAAFDGANRDEYF